MFGNIDPQKMAQVQQVSGQLNSEIRIDHDAHEIRLKFSPTTPESLNFVKGFLPQFAEGIASQLSAFFSIHGEIVDVNKKK